MNRFLLVGDLQVYSTPYISLYSDNWGRLYMLVRISSVAETSQRFLSAYVTPEQVLDFMDGKNGVLSVMNKRKPRICSFEGNNIAYTDESKIVVHNLIKKDIFFNEDYCEDEVEISFYVKNKLNSDRRLSL